MTQDLCYLSASEIQKGLRERRFSAVELSEAVLKRIDRLNPTLGAFQTLLATDSILAARHSDLRHADGSPSGPLDGVPICLSDLARVRDTACTWGSPLAVDAVERTDGAQVGRLREEGVTLVGKTRVAEFALGSVSEGALAGPVRNPWNLDHHVAGPSGGAGAAVAAGLATLALDFDHYGAVRLAAGSSGVFGFTAGRRRVPHVVAHGRNYSDMALMRTGIISRSVEDAATLLQIIAQPDVRDTFADQTLPAHFAERLHQLPKQLRAYYSPDLGFIKVHPVVRELFFESIEQFSVLGVKVDQGPVVLSSDILTHAKHLFAADRYTLIVGQGRRHPDFAQRLGESCREWVRLGNAVTGVQYSMAVTYTEWITRYFIQVLQDHDLVITPFCPLPSLRIDGLPVTLGGEVFDSELGPAAFTLVANYAGLPAMVLPCGFTEDGAPFAVQVMALRGREELLLQLAQAWSQRFPWAQHRPDEAVLTRHGY